MNKAILKSEVQQYIHDHMNEDLNTLIFRKSPFLKVTMAEIVQQIKGKLKAKNKLPSWYGAEAIYYPEKVSLEQTSSEKTAAYKASLVKGKNLADLTGGFGVDSFSFSRKFENVVYLEQNKVLSEIAEWNFGRLGIANIVTHNRESVSFLNEANMQFDCIYADPARRDGLKRKVFKLEDCTPNIPQNMNLLWEYTDCILLKTAPLLDLQQGISDLKNVKEIHVVALNNEVKELIWLLSKQHKGNVKVYCAELELQNSAFFSFEYEEEKKNEALFSAPLNFLYEPNASILKSGAFKTVALTYGIFKLAIHSHLYTSEEQLPFPGRSFLIEEILPFHKKNIRKKFTGTKANITTRNFPWTVAKIRKELQINEGGESYFFFTTDLNGKHLLIICKKI